jgi:hypothetical protein
MNGSSRASRIHTLMGEAHISPFQLFLDSLDPNDPQYPSRRSRQTQDQILTQGEQDGT